MNRFFRLLQRLLCPLIVCCALTAATVATRANAACRPFRRSPEPNAATAPNTDVPIYWLTAGLTVAAAGLSAVQCLRSSGRTAAVVKPKG